MQITDRIHALRLPFTLTLPDGRELARFVYCFLLCGERICLIDAGVASSAEVIMRYLEGIGRAPVEIDRLVLTHAHPDHIGAAAAIHAASGCQVLAHRDAVAWIEDTERQFRERPVPSFHEIVAGPTPVDAALEDGDRIDLGADGALDVMATPGHARGQMALHSARDAALFVADAVPVPGDLPVYEDAVELVRSMGRLLGVAPVEVLLSSWDEPRFGAEARAAIDRGLVAVRTLHGAVMAAREATGSEDAQAVAAAVVERLGLPPAALNPVVVTTIAAHLREAGAGELGRPARAENGG